MNIKLIGEHKLASAFMKLAAAIAFFLVLCISSAFASGSQSGQDDAASLLMNSIQYNGEKLYSLFANAMWNFEQGKSNAGGNSDGSSGKGNSGGSSGDGNSGGGGGSSGGSSGGNSGGAGVGSGGNAGGNSGNAGGSASSGSSEGTASQITGEIPQETSAPAESTSEGEKRISEIIGEKIRQVGLPPGTAISQGDSSQPRRAPRASEIIGDKVEEIISFIEGQLGITGVGGATGAILPKGRYKNDTSITGPQPPPSGGKGSRNGSSTGTGSGKTNTCTNGQYDTGESDIDCGGVCKSNKCSDGLKCTANSDCKSSLCSLGICKAQTASTNTTNATNSTNATCTNTIFDIGESDVDCGGICATKCTNGKTCTTNSSCLSNLCSLGICAQNTSNSTNTTNSTNITNTCTNGIYNLNESDIDCGGACTAKCTTGKNCTLNTDCASAICSSGKCAANATPILPGACNYIKYDGSTANRVNIVMVPSGFEGNMTFFENRARWIASIFNNHAPLSSSIPRLNFMFVPQEAGSFCYFNCSGIDRLLCCDPALAKNISSKCTTGPRQTLVVQNSTKYGGAGYTNADLATTSLNSYAPLVAIHELGHSLFDLGDEYSYGYSGPSYYNCDYAGCSKWADLIGYNAVDCHSACANGQYYASESTMMSVLNRPFEEVNLRYTCCTYGRDTGAYPSYCSQFANLNSYCSLNVSGATQMAAPYEYQLVKDDEGDWHISSVTQKLPGAYPDKKAGKVPGGKKLGIVRGNGASSELTVDSEQDVEYPGDYPSMGGHAKMPLKAFTVVIDHMPGRVQSILIDSQALQVS